MTADQFITLFRATLSQLDHMTPSELDAFKQTVLDEQDSSKVKLLAYDVEVYSRADG